MGWKALTTSSCLPWDRSATSAEFSRALRGLALDLFPDVATPPWLQLRAATLFVGTLAQHPTLHVAVGGRLWQARTTEAQRNPPRLQGSPRRAAELRCGDTPGPFNSRTNVAATSGCRSCTMLSESAPLAQYAETLVRSALRKPMPPNANGSDATPRALLATNS